MSDPVDPVEFGKLLGSMEHLTNSIKDLTSKMEAMEARMNTGKGMVFGLAVAAAGIGGSVGAFMHRMFESVK